MNEKIQAVQSMQDYIGGHSEKNISLVDLAEAAHFSPWYCTRIFKELTGLSPANYIRRLKLSKSALRLRDENVKVIDTAFEAMDRYDPNVIGYEWDDDNPRIQLEPIGKRGYIELRAVKAITK